VMQSLGTTGRRGRRLRWLRCLRSQPTHPYMAPPLLGGQLGSLPTRMASPCTSRLVRGRLH